MALARAGGSMSSPRVIARQGSAHLMSLLCRFCRPERLTAFNVEKAQAGKGLSLTNPPRRTRDNPFPACAFRSEEHTSELLSLAYLVCRLLLEKKKSIIDKITQYYLSYV